jgi:hypothetical protein
LYLQGEIVKKIDVYVNYQGQPKHLAVQQEKSRLLGESPMYRSLCGAYTSGLEVKSVPPKDTHVECQSCKEQLKMWKEVQERG